MRSSIRNRINGILMLVLVIAFFSIISSAFLIYNVLNNNKDIYTMNEQRVATNKIVSYIESIYSEGSDLSYDNIHKKIDGTNLEFRIIDLYGKVIFDSKDETTKSKNMKVDIKSSISYDKSFKLDNVGFVRFSLPIVVEGKQVANAVFIEKDESLLPSVLTKKVLLLLLPMTTGFILIVSLIIFLNYKTRKEILNPIKALNEVAENIAAGNFDKKIKYNNASELGHLCGSFEFMRDELKASLEKQKELEKARKELVACISHDLRTPIASIKAYVEGLKDGIAKDTEKFNKYIAVISKKTDSLVKLINDLFQHSQAELGELEINKKEGYSASILEKIVHPITLEFKGSSITFELEDNFPDVLINVDTVRLEQVIMNLIQNAKKYTPEGGKIILSAELEESFIKVTVKDSGIGISPRDLPFIFEKFYRGEKSRSRDYGGAGLGLSICKYIVEAHGGTIYVESKLEEGSSFTFTMPKV